MASPQGQSYTINGIKVQFPCKAYPSQLSMMDKIIKGLERNQNCLLESPTGSGKSLALLCSALAWQKHERERLESEEECKKDSKCSCGAKSTTSPAAAESNTRSTNLTASGQMPPPALVNTPQRADITPTVPDIEDGDFVVHPKKRKAKNPLPGQTPGAPQAASWNMEVQTPGAPQAASWNMEVQTPVQPLPCQQDACNCQCGDKPPVKKRVPKIYFGTRTHKQIAQIARELGKTAYKHTRMTILGSREHTCIDPVVSRGPNKSEECKNKRDGMGCKFFDRVRKISHHSIQDHGLHSAWDLQQFVGVCEKFQACPYYGSRQLRDGADIIFCPYNYLIDPLVRESMEINLKGQIVIVDEAHNIEDSTREAASYSASHAKIKDALKDLHDMINENIKPTEHRHLYNMLNSFSDFISRNEDSLDGDYDNASRVWTGVDIVATLKHTGVGPDDLDRLKKCFNAVTDDEEEQHAKLKAATMQCMSAFFMVLGYIYRDNMKYLDDYRIAIVRNMVFSYANDDEEDGVWRKKKRRGRGKMTTCFTLHFWCLNPAVAFSDINEGCRSVVLTSGTLSPMNTFQSELAAPFPIQLEANHVISKNQVWVGTVSKGPRGGSLLGSYQNSETYAYQDEIGEVVLKVCQTMPHGVLCFLPSYKSMEKLTTRWKNTGLWQRLEQHKVVMLEPRASDKVDFDSIMKHFYEVISEHGDQDSDSDDDITGALFFAVCRGKVSEGLDFADNNARAVIAVGIPFPSIKDTQIELKKQYNDQRSASRGLLRGRDWYEIQAYRAINQALGRCIRHRNDWGALILVDERYGMNPQKYTKGLSKWIRQRVQYYSTFQQAEHSLKLFTRECMENPTINASVLCMESPSLNPGTPRIPAPGDRLGLADESHNQTPTGVARQQQLIIANQQTPISANQQTPILTNQKAPTSTNQKDPASANQQATSTANKKSAPEANTMLRSFIPISAGANGKQSTIVVDHPLGTVPVLMGGNVIIVPESQIQKPQQPQAPPAQPNTLRSLLDPSKLSEKFVNQSQAGGFLPSQAAGSTQTQTKAGHPTVQQIQNEHQTVPQAPAAQTPSLTQTAHSTQIQAGHRTHSHAPELESGDAVLEFNPSMSSTQVSVMSSDLGITPIKAPNTVSAVTPHGPNTGSEQVFKTPMGKLQLNTPQTKGRPGQTPTGCPPVPGVTPVKPGQATNPLYKFVSLPSPAATPDAGVNQSRSDSPSLFESDDEADGKLDERQISEVLKELGSDDRRVSPNENLAPVPCRKPLFKKQNEGILREVDGTGTGVVAGAPGELDVTRTGGKRLSRNRLSRCSLSKQDLHTGADFTLASMETTPVIIKSEPVLQEKHGNTVKSEPQDVLLKPEEVKEEGWKEEEEMLNTKRTSRNKRRRSGQNNIRSSTKKARKGIDFDDDDDEDEKTVNKIEELAFICPKCRAKLGKFSSYRSESYRPGFIKAMRRPKEPAPAGDLVTVDVSLLPQKGLRVIHSEGPELNSHWSAEDECVVQFLGCVDCLDTMRRPSKTGGPPCLGAHVLMIRKHNPRLKEGQVWLLPQCFKL